MKTSTVLATIALVGVVLLAACSQATPTATPSPTPRAPAVPPGDATHLYFPTDPRPTVAHPQLTLIITATDSQTGRPVRATIAVGSETHTGHQLTVVVAGNVAHRVSITAPGYKPWSVTVKPHIQHHKVIQLRVPLKQEKGKST